MQDHMIIIHASKGHHREGCSAGCLPLEGLPSGRQGLKGCTVYMKTDTIQGAYMGLPLSQNPPQGSEVYLARLRLPAAAL